MKLAILASLLLSSLVMAQTPAASVPSTIRFEDATAKSGIQFTHSFGAEKLGSLLEALDRAASGSITTTTACRISTS